MASETTSFPTVLAQAIAPDLGRIDQLARVYASSYASPHHITFTVAGLRAMIEEFASPPAPAPVQAAPDGFITVAVKNLGPLLDALDRADRKGYLPDAMAAEWQAFELVPVTAAAPSPDPQPIAVSEAERDAARLNWMEANWAAWCGSEHPGMYFGTDWAHRGWIAEKSLRAAIDAAMQAAQGLETKP